MLLVDAANVVGSRPNGWWRDRPGAARDLVERIRTATADAQLAAPVVVVLEGQARRGVEEGIAEGVEIVHAPGEGDDTIASIAAAATEPVLLVSADRGLRERVRAVGGDVVGPGWLRSRVDP
jgi:rRNA-processing protein FCF1